MYMQTQETQLEKIKRLYYNEPHLNGTNFLSFEELEVWKDIEESRKTILSVFGNIISDECLYQVSNFGRIKTKARYVWTGKDYLGLLFVEERILDYKPNGRGYKRIDFVVSKNKKKSFNIHQLVGKYFLDNPNNYKFINHKDGDKTNNYFLNLEYCTSSQNAQHYHQILKPLRQPKNNMAA